VTAPIDLGEPTPPPPGAPAPPVAEAGAPPGPAPAPASTPAPAAPPAAASSQPPVTSTAFASPSPPAVPAAESTPEAGLRPEASRRWHLRRALESSLSLVLLIGVAIAILLAWRGGGASGLAARLRASAAAPALDARVTGGGPYETEAGTAVLVVRGGVAARAATAGPVRVRVEIADGGRVLARGAALAGPGPTPEQVYGAGAPEDLAALRAALDAAAPRQLAQGEEVSFTVLFPAPLPELRGADVRVAAEAGASP